MGVKKYPPVLVGNRYGRLTVLGEDPKKRIDQRCWFVRCVCGSEKSVRQAQLKNGMSQSCGCLQRERSANAGPQRTRHGHTANKTVSGSVSSEYSTWQQMKNRCTNNKCAGWKNYGGRGITVCDRWLNSFEAFLHDVGTKPATKIDGRTRTYSLGRIDNDKGYEPGNVEWQTYLQQAANKRSSDGVVKVGYTLGNLTVIELTGAKRCRIRCSCGKEKTLSRAYFRSGWGRCSCSKKGRAEPPEPSPIKRKRKIENREPWQIALHEASKRRKNKQSPCYTR